MEPPRYIKDVQRLTRRVVSLGRFIFELGNECFSFFKTLKKFKHFVWTTESQEAFEQLKKCIAETPLLAKPSPGETLYLYLAVSE